MHGVLKQHHGNSLVDQLVRGFPGGPDGKESVPTSLTSPALAVRFFTTSTTWEALLAYTTPFFPDSPLTSQTSFFHCLLVPILLPSISLMLVSQDFILVLFFS